MQNIYPKQNPTSHCEKRGSLSASYVFSLSKKLRKNSNIPGNLTPMKLFVKEFRILRMTVS